MAACVPWWTSLSAVTPGGRWSRGICSQPSSTFSLRGTPILKALSPRDTLSLPCVAPTYTVGSLLPGSAHHRTTTHDVSAAAESFSASNKAAAACPGGSSWWVAAECHPRALSQPLSCDTESLCVNESLHLEVGVGATSSCQEKREFSAVLGDGTAMDTISLVLSVDSPPCGIVEFCCACVCFLLKWLLEGLLRLTNSISFCCGLVALLQMSNYSFVSQNHSWDLRFISSQLLSADRLKKR